MAYVFNEEPDYLTQLAPDAQAAPKFIFDDPVPQKESKSGYSEDIAKSAVYRGIPEGLAGATPLGFGLNVVRGVSDLTRWAAGKAYKGFTGDELPHYAGENPIPSSSDVLQGASRGLLGQDLYEPQTVPGQYANTLAQFASGGAATGLPLRTTVPAAVASETAGQATQGTDWEVPARIAGAVAGAGAFSRNSGSSGQALTADQIRENASNLYKLAEEKGGILKEDVANNFISQLNSAKPAKIAGKILTSEDKTLIRALDEFKDLKDTKLSLSDFQRLDESLGAKAENFVDPLTGKLTKPGVKIARVQQGLRDLVENAPESSVVGGKEGFVALKQATSEWAKQARLRDIERIVSRAENMQQPATAIKSAFNSLLHNPEKLRGYTDAEKALIKDAARTGIVSDILRTGGSRLIPIVAGSAGGGLLGGSVGYAGSALSRGLANKIQFDKANKVAEAIATRGQPKPQSPLIELLQSDVAPKKINRTTPLKITVPTKESIERKRK